MNPDKLLRDMAAFPVSDGPLYHQEPGMNLRDYFAAKVMQTMLTNYGHGNMTIAKLAEAYKIADMMLAAREQ